MNQPMRSSAARRLLVAFVAALLTALVGAGALMAQENEGDETRKVKTLEDREKDKGDPAAEGGEGATDNPAQPEGGGEDSAQGELPSPEESSVTYDMRVRELEEKVNDLKEKIFRSKSRLVLLKETVLRGSLSGSKAVLLHKNDMGNSFLLEHAVYSLDGNQIFNERDDDGSLADKESFEIFNGAIVPGNHNVSVQLVYRGNGFGVFSYLSGYKFTIRSSYTFTAEEGKSTQVRIISYEKGDVTTALEDKPDVKYEIEFFDDQEGKASAQKSK